ncbi:hypothetical protein D3C75_1252130 [compost metagenome]
MAVKDTIMVSTGPTKPACTADWPITRAPTIPMVWPMVPGRRRLASRKSSMLISISRASKKAGNGTPVRLAALESISGVGSISW